MLCHDAFDNLARYYDRLMAHVDYDRWTTTTSALAGLLPEKCVHVDVACGTGRLAKMLRRRGWRSFGIDLSPAMLRAGRTDGHVAPCAVADFRALPFCGRIDYVTCLFDSINFLLTPGDVRKAIAEMAGALSGNGLIYLDAITELMVIRHFADQTWTERNTHFRSTWDNRYDQEHKIAETAIQINNGPPNVLPERVYERAELEQAFSDAGLTVLGVFDAQTWAEPGKNTTRLDFVAVRRESKRLRKSFDAIRRNVCRNLI